MISPPDTPGVRAQLKINLETDQPTVKVAQQWVLGQKEA